MGAWKWIQGIIDWHPVHERRHCGGNGVYSILYSSSSILLTPFQVSWRLSPKPWGPTRSIISVIYFYLMSGLFQRISSKPMHIQIYLLLFLIASCGLLRASRASTRQCLKECQKMKLSKISFIRKYYSWIVLKVYDLCKRCLGSCSKSDWFGALSLEGSFTHQLSPWGICCQFVALPASECHVPTLICYYRKFLSGLC